MSLRYRNGSGEETVISGLTPGGDIESGAVATRSGSFNITFNGSATSEGNVAVTFDQPMPDADYDVSFSYNGQWTGVSLYANQKTANGFNVCYANIVSSTATRTYNYRAIKTYTVQHAAQNAESIANLEAMVPTGAGSGNKLVTASQLTNTTNPIATDVANLKELVPVGASITNQLVTKSETSVDSALSSTSEHAVQNKIVKAALDGKQDVLEYDVAPTDNSNKMVKSGGIKIAIDQVQTNLDAFASQHTIALESYGRTLAEIEALNKGDHWGWTGNITIDGTTWSSGTRFRCVQDLDYTEHETTLKILTLYERNQRNVASYRGISNDNGLTWGWTRYRGDVDYEFQSGSRSITSSSAGQAGASRVTLPIAMSDTEYTVVLYANSPSHRFILQPKIIDTTHFDIYWSNTWSTGLDCQVDWQVYRLPH